MLAQRPRFVATLIITVMLLTVCGVLYMRNQSRVAAKKCSFYLMSIDAAKEQWAWEHHQNSNASPTWDDIRPYLENVIWGCAASANGEKLPHCPKGGEYTLGRVGDLTRCSVPGHKAADIPRIVLVVEDESQRPIVGAKIAVRDAFGGVSEVQTDSNGAVNFKPWIPGAVAISVSSDGYVGMSEMLKMNQPPLSPLRLKKR